MSNRREAEMKRGGRKGWLAVAVLGFAAVPALVFAATRNHNFDLVDRSVVVCQSSATFDGTATLAGSLNLLMTSQILDGTGSTLIATGNTHTFTTVGETFTFVVPYPIGTFNVGDLVTLSVTDVPPTILGNEGDATTATVTGCVPTVPGWGLAFLALALLAGGGTLLARVSRARSARLVSTS